MGALKNTGYHEYLGSKHWKKLRKTVFSQQGRLCSVCKQAYATDPHHVSYGRKLIWVGASNLRPVCRECHDVIHWLIDTGKLVYRSKRVGSRWKQTLQTLAAYHLLPDPEHESHYEAQ